MQTAAQQSAEEAISSRTGLLLKIQSGLRICSSQLPAWRPLWARRLFSNELAAHHQRHLPCHQHGRRQYSRELLQQVRRQPRQHQHHLLQCWQWRQHQCRRRQRASEAPGRQAVQEPARPSGSSKVPQAENSEDVTVYRGLEGNQAAQTGAASAAPADAPPAAAPLGVDRAAAGPGGQPRWQRLQCERLAPLLSHPERWSLEVHRGLVQTGREYREQAPANMALGSPQLQRW